MSMEPLVIITDNNGKVAMSVNEIKALLDKAYKMGKDSGNRYYNWYPSNWWSSYPSSTTTTYTASNVNGTVTLPSVCVKQKEQG